MCRLIVLCALCSFSLSAVLVAEPIAEPASQRFAQAVPDEVPDFQRHIMPMLGKLGCNGRSCHGSFQGRGGFRLSLFGYDPVFDHEALVKVKTHSGETLINRESPQASLLLSYPIDGDVHEGGMRFQRDSWEYRLFEAWIRGDAGGTEKPGKLQRLEVEPNEWVFHQAGEKVQLRILAHWDDGSQEDVTCLSRFQTNNESMVDVDDNGMVTSVGQGDSHVVVFYESGVAAIPILMPVSDRTGDRYPQVGTPTKVDELVVRKLRKLGIVPSESCTDGEFLRRVSLDITGSLPTAEEATEFLADSSADKRARKIDELLERPAYAAWWATKFCDLTGNNPQSMGETAFRNEQSEQWYRWTYARIRENIPYDDLVARMLLAVGREHDESYDDYASEMTSYVRQANPADFADRETMPHYWSRNTLKTPADRALGVAYAFLGIRIQCAQCHKHPFDRWTQQDFVQFSNFFQNISYNVSRESRESYDRMQEDLGMKGMQGGDARKLMTQLGKDGKTVPFREVFVTPVALNKQNAKKPSYENPAIGKLLAAEEVDLTKCRDPREPVVEWMRRNDNAWFARAFVNRVWAHYFHAGIVNPPDDMNLANPPSNTELLDYLAEAFVANDFDMKWLHREITNSQTYQLSWRPNETNRMDQRNFSRAIPRRLPAEVAYDALVKATSTADKVQSFVENPNLCSISHASIASSTSRYAMGVFGKPARETTCDCERASEPTLLQSVYLQNDKDVLAMIDRGGWLARLNSEFKKSKKFDEEACIREIYLRTVTRYPTEAELDECRAYVAEAESPVDAIRDLLWTLLNTKEFVVNH